MTVDKLPPEFEEAKRYVIDNESFLRKKYERNVIAVLGGSGVIDYDQNKFDLHRRINERTYNSINPLLGTIDDILNPIEVEISSPEETS